jgi:hypothetical protein
MSSHPKEMAEDFYAGFKIIQKNNSVINLILVLLVFSTNYCPPSKMAAGTASTVNGRCPKYTNRLLTPTIQLII